MCGVFPFWTHLQPVVHMGYVKVTHILLPGFYADLFLFVIIIGVVTEFVSG